MRHIYTLVSKLPLRLNPTLTSCGHATHHLTLCVEAFDPYISTQVNGIHTIARCMDDEIKLQEVNPQCLYLLSHLRSLTGHKGNDHWHTLDSNFRLGTNIYNYKLPKTGFGKQKPLF